MSVTSGENSKRIGGLNMKITRSISVLILIFAAAPNTLQARGTDEAASADTRPERIVQVGSSAFMVENAMYMFPEASGRIIAMADGNQGSGFFAADLDADINSKVILPRTANTEAVLALNPDVVVMKDFLRSRMGEPLERVGVKTLYLNLETPEAWIEDLDLLGGLFGNTRRAAELKQLFKERLSSVEIPLADMAENRKPRTLLLYWSVKDGATAVNIPPLSWIQTRMVEMAGGDPVWKNADLGERWTQTGIEQIAAWNPEVIIVAAYHVNAVDAVELIRLDPTWSSLDAVKNGNLHAFPGDYYSWDQPDARWLLGLQWLASTLHPEEFPDLNMESEARTFFRDFYFLDEADFNSLIAPRLSGLD